MENKKQLVIVPPMSEPLQKLNEVLNGIAVDENIEISLIDDYKELSQFVGSAGQSLILFSNAKKCATFLQDNRFVIAKTHSKIILLTPKEIPTKTLIKFVKIGLTESVLENSPPKTLLYKVKLLLRSIKSSSTQEEKDQIVKSMLDQTLTAATGPLEKTEEDKKEDTLNYLSEERLKNKDKDKGDAPIDEGGNLKGKNNYQEESIETNWKSKRKKETMNSLDNESDIEKIDSDDSDNIDLYYRGKKKSNYQETDEESNLRTKKINDEETDTDVYYKKNKQTEIDLSPSSDADKKRTSSNQETEDDNSLSKTENLSLKLDAADDTAKKEIPLSEAEKYSAKKKEFDELEELFEAAKRKMAEQAEDLGGHYKGKVSNTDLELEENLTKEKKEYDNSELYQREKQFDLELHPAAEEKKRHGVEEDDDYQEKKNRKGQVDAINRETQSNDCEVDKIDTNMVGEINNDKSNNLSELDIYKLAPKVQNETLNNTEDLEKAKTKNQVDDSDDASNEKKTDYQDDQKNEENKRKQQTELMLEEGIVPPSDDLRDSSSLNNESDNKHPKASGLQLLDENDAKTRTRMEEPDAHMSFKKLAQTNLELGVKEKNIHNGNVDKIDTFYRGGDAKKNADHSWDNLTNAKASNNSEIKKLNRRPDEFSEGLLKKNAGEITIDYRKLKEEFDYIARNGSSEESADRDGGRVQGLSDSEDSGTFKVIEIDTRGFEFGVEVLNFIYQKDSKIIEFYQMISEELISKYKAYPLFYTYKATEKVHIAAFDSLVQLGDFPIPMDLKEWWNETKKDQAIFDYYYNKTMTTWLCRSLNDKSDPTAFWQDVELPTWASNELSDKKVEMIFPYFDGIDRMGLAIIFFPDGVNPAQEKSLLLTLEMARSVLLDSIQRTSVSNEENLTNEAPGEKKNIINRFSGLFNRNKAS